MRQECDNAPSHKSGESLLFLFVKALPMMWKSGFVNLKIKKYESN